MDKTKLPIGIDSFREIRDEKYYYVDKTAFAARMIGEAKYNFLSRPRRFGKSLFVDTLKNLFEGKKELFEGLDIYDKWDWTVEYPVLRFRFTKGTFEIPGYLERNVAGQLDVMEEEAELSSDYDDAPERLAYLIRKLVKETGQRVVILVDEYDKPIYDALDAPGSEDVARANRAYLRGFYATIKECNEDIRFGFLTGVTKFARAGIFSGINNMRDITIDPRYSSICGYTENDLDTVFASELEKLENINREKIKEWYNGYNWGGEENVYNPFSILMLFDKRKLESWWFETGTPTFLINMLKKRGGIGTLGLDGMSASNDLLSTFDVGNIKVPALLFQAGYLTIARKEEKENRTRYILDYPNHEVRQSLHVHLLDALTDHVGVDKISEKIYNALLSSDKVALKEGIHALFSRIPNDAYRKNQLAGLEAHYASVVYTCLAGTTLNVHAEDPTNHGRTDMTVETDTAIYVLECKVLGPKAKPGDAIRQIRDRGYADKFRSHGIPVYLVGMEFEPKERNIKHLDFEPV